MADTVRKVEYFSIHVSNTPAKAFGVLSTLVSSGIDLLACIGVPRGRRARIDVVPADTRRFKAAVKKAGLTPEQSEIGKYAENAIPLEGVKAQQMLKLVEALEDNDDVQNVWANFDFEEE